MRDQAEVERVRDRFTRKDWSAGGGRTQCEDSGHVDCTQPGVLAMGSQSPVPPLQVICFSREKHTHEDEEDERRKGNHEDKRKRE